MARSSFPGSGDSAETVADLQSALRKSELELSQRTAEVKDVRRQLSATTSRQARDREESASRIKQAEEDAKLAAMASKQREQTAAKRTVTASASAAVAVQQQLQQRLARAESLHILAKAEGARARCAASAALFSSRFDALVGVGAAFRHLRYFALTCAASARGATNAAAVSTMRRQKNEDASSLSGLESANAELRASLKAANKDLSAYRKETRTGGSIASLRSELATSTQAQAALADQVKALQKRTRDVSGRRDGVQAQLLVQSNAAAETDAELASLRREHAALRSSQACASISRLGKARTAVAADTFTQLRRWASSAADLDAARAAAAEQERLSASGATAAQRLESAESDVTALKTKVGNLTAELSRLQSHNYDSGRLAALDLMSRSQRHFASSMKAAALLHLRRFALAAAAESSKAGFESEIEAAQHGLASATAEARHARSLESDLASERSQLEALQRELGRERNVGQQQSDELGCVRTELKTALKDLKESKSAGSESRSSAVREAKLAREAKAAQEAARAREGDLRKAAKAAKAKADRAAELFKEERAMLTNTLTQFQDGLPANVRHAHMAVLARTLGARAFGRPLACGWAHWRCVFSLGVHGARREAFERQAEGLQQKVVAAEDATTALLAAYEDQAEHVRRMSREAEASSRALATLETECGVQRHNTSGASSSSSGGSGTKRFSSAQARHCARQLQVGLGVRRTERCMVLAFTQLRMFAAGRAVAAVIEDAVTNSEAYGEKRMQSQLTTYQRQAEAARADRVKTAASLREAQKEIKELKAATVASAAAPASAVPASSAAAAASTRAASAAAALSSAFASTAEARKAATSAEAARVKSSAEATDLRRQLQRQTEAVRAYKEEAKGSTATQTELVAQLAAVRGLLTDDLGCDLVRDSETGRFMLEELGSGSGGNGGGTNGKLKRQQQQQRQHQQHQGGSTPKSTGRRTPRQQQQHKSHSTDPIKPEWNASFHLKAANRSDDSSLLLLRSPGPPGLTAPPSSTIGHPRGSQYSDGGEVVFSGRHSPDGHGTGGAPASGMRALRISPGGSASSSSPRGGSGAAAVDTASASVPLLHAAPDFAGSSQQRRRQLARMSEPQRRKMACNAVVRMVTSRCRSLAAAALDRLVERSRVASAHRSSRTRVSQQQQKQKQRDQRGTATAAAAAESGGMKQQMSHVAYPGNATPTPSPTYSPRDHLGSFSSSNRGSPSSSYGGGGGAAASAVLAEENAGLRRRLEIAGLSLENRVTAVRSQGAARLLFVGGCRHFAHNLLGSSLRDWSRKASSGIYHREDAAVARSAAAQAKDDVDVLQLAVSEAQEREESLLAAAEASSEATTAQSAELAATKAERATLGADLRELKRLTCGWREELSSLRKGKESAERARDTAEAGLRDVRGRVKGATGARKAAETEARKFLGEKKALASTKEVSDAEAASARDAARKTLAAARCAASCTQSVARRCGLALRMWGLHAAAAAHTESEKVLLIRLHGAEGGPASALGLSADRLAQDLAAATRRAERLAEDKRSLADAARSLEGASALKSVASAWRLASALKTGFAIFKDFTTASRAQDGSARAAAEAAKADARAKEAVAALEALQGDADRLRGDLAAARAASKEKGAVAEKACADVKAEQKARRELATTVKAREEAWSRGRSEVEAARVTATETASELKRVRSTSSNRVRMEQTKTAALAADKRKAEEIFQQHEAEAATTAAAGSIGLHARRAAAAKQLFAFGRWLRWCVYVDAVAMKDDQTNAELLADAAVKEMDALRARLALVEASAASGHGTRPYAVGLKTLAAVCKLQCVAVFRHWRIVAVQTAAVAFDEVRSEGKRLACENGELQARLEADTGSLTADNQRLVSTNRGLQKDVKRLEEEARTAKTERDVMRHARRNQSVAGGGGGASVAGGSMLSAGGTGHLR